MSNADRTGPSDSLRDQLRRLLVDRARALVARVSAEARSADDVRGVEQRLRTEVEAVRRELASADLLGVVEEARQERPGTSGGLASGPRPTATGAREAAEVGGYVRRLRAALGLSTAQLADELSEAGPAVAAASLDALEAGREGLDPEQLARLEARLGTPPGELQHLYGFLTAEEAAAYRSAHRTSRAEWLASEEFERTLSEHFARAGTAAIADLHRAGLPAHARVDGEPTEIPPPETPR